MKQIVKKAVMIGMVCVCMFFSADVFSQWYLGGSLRSIWGNAGAKSGDYTQIRMVPEAGYTFNRWGIGFAPEINYIHWGFDQDESISYTKSLDFGLRLYSRYTLFRGSAVSLFLDGEVYLSYLGNLGSPYIGIKPGVAYKMSEHCMATMHFGMLGYGQDMLGLNKDMLGLDLSGNSLGLSLFYVFGKKNEDVKM